MISIAHFKLWPLKMNWFRTDGLTRGWEDRISQILMQLKLPQNFHENIGKIHYAALWTIFKRRDYISAVWKGRGMNFREFFENVHIEVMLQTMDKKRASIKEMTISQCIQYDYM